MIRKRKRERKKERERERENKRKKGSYIILMTECLLRYRESTSLACSQYIKKQV